MSSLLALLSQQTPNLQTRKGLILLGLQNDFVDSKGKLPVNETGYLDRIIQLVPAFREFGDIIWVRSEYEANRPVNGLDTPGDTVIAGGSSGRDDDVPSSARGSGSSKQSSSKSTKRFKVAPDFYLEEWSTHADDPKPSPKSTATLPRPDEGENDEELFLTRTSTRDACCVKGSRGAEYADRIKPLVRQGKDMQVVKSHYSAFGATSLLLTLRSKLITELYVCGNMTNLSVYATAMDAARYGIRIILITDCLGYRREDRHDQAIKQLQSIMLADIIKSDKVIDELRNPTEQKPNDSEDDSEEEDEEEEEGESQESQEEADDDALEADSDDGSDEEVTLPSVRGPRKLKQWLEQRSSSGSGKNSRPLASEQQQRPHSSSQRTQPAKAAPEPSRRHSQQTTSSSRSFDASTASKKQPKLDTTCASSSHQRRLGIVESPESPRLHKEPWLSLIPHNSAQSTRSLAIRPKHPGLAALSAAANLSPSTIAEYEEMMHRAQGKQNEVSIDDRSKPLFGEGKEAECAGSCILYDLLPTDLAETIFDELNREVEWQTMFHQTGEVPRLVCCQGTVDADGSMPVYRHPSDQTMPIQTWTPAVDRVRKAAEKVAGHSLNHALIQLYRGGTDFISEHSDKTLDIAPGSKIVNVSFGAQRTMRLRTKRTPTHNPLQPTCRTTYRVPMPHNSMITMSLETNAKYLHGITADKRPAVELVEAEKAYDGQRISLTFRNIGTFLNEDSSKIWGQGAVAKTKHDARRVINGDAAQSERLTRAFGAENQASSICWEEIYGGGFDVLHLRSATDVEK